MCPIIAIYGKEDILAYVRGVLDDAEEEQEIESLVESDPRAAKVVEKIRAGHLGDAGTFDLDAMRRLRKLQEIANTVHDCSLDMR